ncbi:MAG: hypothetical protein NTX03_13470 [Bacteroidetes bacterium]|nr:hypothetical protein [Bacteroidota bacterium]
MKKFTTILFCALMFVVTVSKAQTVLQLNGTDCNGNTHAYLQI